MRTTLIRAAAVAGVTALLGTAGALTTFDTANAVAVTGDADMQRIVIHLDHDETVAAATSWAGASPYCDSAIAQAGDAGQYFSQAAKNNCKNSLWQCAQWASSYGYDYVGVKFEGDTGVPQCLRPADLS
ncbi:MAG TPA: hypothetical protein VHW64_08915 [Nocardioides sp.]|uniref:hypothetical protein n=1 Tax=Nocardioides sp. TaxID=35761 RepID=UPI002E34BA7A|nr:hypothetical protein [Nocardioides sp.]HEX3930812.1 hypothetical protein [Nocardioides sp.]